MIPPILPLTIEPTILQQLLNNNINIKIIDVCHPSLFDKLHIPKAIQVKRHELISQKPPATGMIPHISDLERLFSRIGYQKDTHYIVYDDEGGGWAGRFIWTLDMIGHKHYSYLNGGLHSWLKESLPTESGHKTITPTTVNLSLYNEARATKDYILNKIGNDQVVFWDTRSPEEYQGKKILSQRSGHIPNAINFDWILAMDTNNSYRIKANILESLQKIGITPDKEIITYCQSFHRAAFSYLVAKALGFPSVKGYDGSWSEWGNLQDTPINNELSN